MTAYEAEQEAAKNVFEKIYAVVRQIPRGKTATYGQVARLAGNPRWSRVVGYALHVNPDPDGIPCYRVVNRFGQVSKALPSEAATARLNFLRRTVSRVRTGRWTCPYISGKVLRRHKKGIQSPFLFIS